MEISQETKTKIQSLIQQFIKQYQAAVKSSGHVASGALSTESGVEVGMEDGQWSIKILLPPQWQYIEDGTRPHFPPVDAILKWIQIKRILPRADARGRIPTEKALAFMIARKMSRVGTTGHHILEQTKSDFDLTKKLKDIIVGAYKQQAYDIIEENLYNS